MTEYTHDSIRDEIQNLVMIQQHYIIAMYTITAVLIGFALDRVDRHVWLFLVPQIVLIPLQRIVDAKKYLSMKLSAFLAAYSHNTWEIAYTHFEEDVFSPSYKKTVLSRWRLMRVSSLHLSILCFVLCSLKCLFYFFETHQEIDGVYYLSYTRADLFNYFVPCALSIAITGFMVFWCSNALNAYDTRKKYYTILRRDPKRKEIISMKDLSIEEIERIVDRWETEKTRA